MVAPVQGQGYYSATNNSKHYKYECHSCCPCAVRDKEPVR